MSHYNHQYQPQYYEQPQYPVYQEAYPMHDYQQNYHHDPLRMSQIEPQPEKFSRSYQKDKKRGCCNAFCCGCCSCCPRWCRWLTCIIFLIIVMLGIAIAVLSALFKTPKIDFKGTQGQPVFGLQGTTVNLNTTLGFTIDNPNIESITFKKIDATGYYKGDTTELGGGSINDLHIGSNSITNVNFPLNIAADVMSNASQTVVKKILDHCNSATDIPIDYKVVATISIFGLPISIPYSNSVNIPCPLDASTTALLSQIQTLLTALTSGASLIPTSTSDIANGISSLIPSDVVSSVASAIEDFL